MSAVAAKVFQFSRAVSINSRRSQTLRVVELRAASELWWRPPIGAASPGPAAVAMARITAARAPRASAGETGPTTKGKEGAQAKTRVGLTADRPDELGPGSQTARHRFQRETSAVSSVMRACAARRASSGEPAPTRICSSALCPRCGGPQRVGRISAATGPARVCDDPC